MAKLNPPEFLLIPKQLLEDKEITLIDERVYGIIYWLSKMKSEKCTASNQTMAEVAKANSGTVANSLTKLESKGFIKRLYKDEAHKIRSEIIPLVVFGVSFTNERVSPTNDTPVSPTNEQSSNTEIKNKSKIYSTAQSAEGSREVINLFKEVNPSYKILFSRKNQHEAAKRLLETHGFEKLKDMITALPKIIALPYAPKPTTPIELERDMGKLKAFAEQKRNEKKVGKYKVAVII